MSEQQPQSIEAPGRLLATKLQVPRLGRGIVSRPRLTERLDEALRGPLALVVAPAGAGKTTLLVEWAATLPEGVRLAWLALEAADSDLPRFLRYLAATLQTVQPGAGAAMVESLALPQPALVESLLTLLINDLAALPAETVLVLDDYQAIDAPAVHEAVGFLVEHMPPRLRLALASRADPPLPLSRLRARGQLVELRGPDLSFDAEEALEFLNGVMGLGLPPAEAATLETRTEGWAAGLQLAALSLRGRDDVAGFIADFTGSHRYVLDYLADEVLDHQPPAVRDFLLRTSVLDRLCAGLCAAVVGDQWSVVGDQGIGNREWGIVDGEPRAGSREAGTTPSTPYPLLPIPSSSRTRHSQAMLERLEREGLFVVALDERRGWYRYHQLFAGALRERLRREQAGLVGELQRRAAEWYEGQGLPDEAVPYALEGGDFEGAARLIEQIAEASLARYEIGTLLAWTRRLPRETLRRRPRLSLAEAWALILEGDFVAAEERLRDVEGLIGEKGDDALAGEVAAVRASMAAMTGDAERIVPYSRRALDLLPAERRFLRSIITLNLGVAYRLSWDAAAARAILGEVVTPEQTGGVMVCTFALLNLTLLELQLGRLTAAEEWARRALRAGRTAAGAPLPLVAMAEQWLGEIFYQRDDLPAAAGHLEECIRMSGEGWVAVTLPEAQLALARVRHAQGDDEAAAALIAQARQAAREREIADLEHTVAVLRTRLWLDQGEVAAAEGWLRGLPARAAPATPEPHLQDEYFTRARVLIATGNAAAALLLLDWTRRHYEATGANRALIEALLLLALAHQATGANGEAQSCLERGVALAEPEGFVRLFVDEGPAMRRLLREAKTRRRGRAYLDLLLAAFDPGPPPTSSLPAPFEQLSPREIELLRLLAAGQGTEEIAATLVIAPATVRSHLKSIFGKLDAHSRMQAVERARALHLI